MRIIAPQHHWDSSFLGLGCWSGRKIPGPASSWLQLLPLSPGLNLLLPSPSPPPFPPELLHPVGCFLASGTPASVSFLHYSGIHALGVCKISPLMFPPLCIAALHSLMQVTIIYSFILHSTHALFIFVCLLGLFFLFFLFFFFCLKEVLLPLCIFPFIWCRFSTFYPQFWNPTCPENWDFFVDWLVEIGFTFLPAKLSWPKFI